MSFGMESPVMNFPRVSLICLSESVRRGTILIDCDNINLNILIYGSKEIYHIKNNERAGTLGFPHFHHWQM